MMNEKNEILFSQLADGELPSDQVNELLLEILDLPEERERLKGFLRLRNDTIILRCRQPNRMINVVAERPRTIRLGEAMRHWFGPAVAACIGGLLVMAGVWAAGWMGKSGGREKMGDEISSAAPMLVGVQRPSESVSPDQMQQVAKVFALHESVAGPLAWYAADDQNVRLASAVQTRADQTPIGVLMKLKSARQNTAARTVVIVCRDQQQAMIELPGEAPGQAPLRVFLMPRTVNGKVEMQYALAVEGQSLQTPLASISGQQRLGLAETPLGQLALSDGLLNIEAAAWPIKQDQK